MRIIADLHVHSKYAYATSPAMVLPSIAEWAGYKGLGLLGTGDFTHPAWLASLKEELVPAGYGTYAYRGLAFFLNGEVSLIFRRGKTCYKVHVILFVPDFAAADRVTAVFARYGKLASDGRPTLLLDPAEMVRIVKDISPDCLVVPAHAWTPHFGVFGSRSGFDSLEECFLDQTGHVHAVETGLSSDPEMNWRVSALDRIALLSNSDAHSPENLGREANVFSMAEGDGLYRQFAEIIRTRDRERFLCTVEFFPEEGKYHFDGNRNLGICIDPRTGTRPPAGADITVGVLHRVEDLADRRHGEVPPGAIPFRKMIPLREIIADAEGAGRATKKVGRIYFDLIREFGSEFAVLLDVPEDDLLRSPHRKAAEGVVKVRRGEVEIEPGYDGRYGVISVGRAAGASAHCKKRGRVI